MGLFAKLVNSVIDCPKCGDKCHTTWQFYFGQVSDLPEYEIGDSIRWDNYRQYGTPEMDEVYAIAYPEDDWICNKCKLCVLVEVPIIKGVIYPIRFLEYGHHKSELIYVGHDRVPYYFDEGQKSLLSAIPYSER